MVQPDTLDVFENLHGPLPREVEPWPALGLGHFLIQVPAGWKASILGSEIAREATTHPRNKGTAC